MAAEGLAREDLPFSVVVEAGWKPTLDWALYADVWGQPTAGRYGTDVAARYKGSLDIYAGALIDAYTGSWEASAGLKYHY